MKCVRMVKDQSVVRVRNDVAERMVDEKIATYAPKIEYKNQEKKKAVAQ